jgi:hypothetical protein
MLEWQNRTSDPRVMSRWADALRSGKYPQSTGSLRNARGWCCLGVLCDVAIDEGLPVVVSESNDDCFADGPLAFFDGCGQYLPSTVVRWAGLPSENPIFRLDEQGAQELNEWWYDRHNQPWPIGALISLAEMNDCGVPFQIIAGLVERVV